MNKKELSIIISMVVMFIITTVLLIPGVIIGTDDGSMSVIRMYSNTLDGPWENMANENTKWVQEKSTYNGQTVIVIRPIGDFLWEAPEGTLVFMPNIPESRRPLLNGYITDF